MNQSHTYTLCISCIKQIKSPKNIATIQGQQRE